MTLSTGTRLGRYEILSPLGAGGMGEVYRARDTRLERTVAIKVLPEGLAGSPEALARFASEARAVAALSHPNILALFDVGEADGVHYAVSELLEGETLRAAMAHGPMPLRRALEIARGVADGLAAAHEKGIVHRDVKPENVFLTKDGRAKVLDFGLARHDVSRRDPDDTRSPTLAAISEKGVVLGTVAYMSPEQARGGDVDFRSDQFSFGSLLYEMFAGRRPFGGGSPTETLAAILRDEPEPLEKTAPPVPAPVRWIVERCLAKEPGERFASTRDLARDLAKLRDHLSEVSLSAPVVTALSAARRRLTLAAAAALFISGAVIALLAVRAWRPAGHPARVVRFPLAPPAGHAFPGTVEATELAVSPDGSRIALVAAPAGASAGSYVFIRDLRRIESRRLEGTEGAGSVFWAPDGRALGFFTPTKLKRVDTDGGAPVTICDLPAGPGRSATWSSRGDILFAVFQDKTLWRVRDSGGQPEPVLRANPALREIRVWWPCFLPDGERFLYVVRREDDTKRLMLGQLGKPSRVLMPVQTAVQYVDPGLLIFAEEGQLLARRFDTRAGTVSGQPIAIADHVSYFRATGHPAFAASRSGTIVYQSHDSVSRLAFFGATGREIASGPRADYMSMWMGRDGRRVLVDRLEHDVGAYDVWSFDVERAVETRITSTPDTEVAALGLADGSIVYSVDRQGQPQLYRLVAGREEIMAPGEGAFQMSSDVSPDGSTLLYLERTAQGPFDLLALPLTPPGKPYAVLRGPYQKSSARFSPDGLFIAFISTESGQPEAYLMRFPSPGERTRISTAGASQVRFSHDGTQLFYISASQRVMAVPILTSPTLQIGAARELFTITGRAWTKFEPLPDGRFLAILPEVIAAEQPLTVIVNWTPQHASAE